jgi:hypothetical protein
VARGHPVPLTSQVAVDRDAVYDVIDRLRFSLPFAIKNVRWFRQKREADGDPPLRESTEELLSVLDCVDRLDDLLRSAPPVPLSSDVRVKRDRLATLLDRLRSRVVPLGQELADLSGIYPDAQGAGAAAATEQEPDSGSLVLLPLIDELDELARNAKRVPLTTQVRIDLERLQDITDRLRETTVRLYRTD